MQKRGENWGVVYRINLQKVEMNLFGVFGLYETKDNKNNKLNKLKTQLMELPLGVLTKPSSLQKYGESYFENQILNSLENLPNLGKISVFMRPLTQRLTTTLTNLKLALDRDCYNDIIRLTQQLVVQIIHHI